MERRGSEFLISAEALCDKLARDGQVELIFRGNRRKEVGFLTDWLLRERMPELNESD